MKYFKVSIPSAKHAHAEFSTQDILLYEDLVFNESTYSIIVLCDGAGSCEFALEGATEQASFWLKLLKNLVSQNFLEGFLLPLPQHHLLRESIISGIKEFRNQQIQKFGLTNIHKRHATLLVALICRNFGVIFFRIGDSEAYVTFSDGTTEQVFPDLAKKYYNETNFPLEVNAEINLQYRSIQAESFSFFLCSDGFEPLSMKANGYPNQELFKTLDLKLLEASDRQKLYQLEDELTQYLLSPGIKNLYFDDLLVFGAKYASKK
jgi:serine/threonine protein phosphatase PrpC